MRPERQFLRVLRIHLQPCVRRHPLENRYLTGLGARVPVLDRASSIENEREFVVRLFRKRFPLDAEQLGSAVLCLKTPVRVKTARDDFLRTMRKRPLDSSMLLDEVIAHPGVVAESSGGNSLPLLECILRCAPA